MFTYTFEDGKLIPHFVPDEYKYDSSLYIPIPYADITKDIDWTVIILALHNELMLNNLYTYDDINSYNGKKILLKLVQKHFYNKIRNIYSKETI